MRRYCLTLDLQRDAEKIATYRRYHEDVWPEVKANLVRVGVIEMEIYLLGTRMFMIMEVTDTFSFEAKAEADKANPKVMEWEALMGQFQDAPADASPVARWQLMEKVFTLSEQL